MTSHMTGQHGATAVAEHHTGIQDKNYNLISVLYHALQGGETCMQYIQDAEHAGDEELRQFFHEVQECQRHLADRAKVLLRQRLGQGNGHEASRDTAAMGAQRHTHTRTSDMGTSHMSDQGGRGRPEPMGATDAGYQDAERLARMGSNTQDRDRTERREPAQTRQERKR